MKINNTNFSRIRILHKYLNFIAKAETYYNNKSYNKCINFIMIAARWMYYFNIIYFDNILESLILSVSKSLLPSNVKYEPDKDCVIFIDSIGTTKCLCVQYLSALMYLRKRIIYINHYHTSKSSDIIAILKNYENKEIHVIDSKLSYTKTAITINNIITANCPSDIILHLYPEDAVSLIAISNICNATKYNIDLQDHTFWLGKSFIDYDFVFRHYGEEVGITRRGFRESQIIRLPYYPLVKSTSKFKGFPPDVRDDAIIVFTGSSPYKMLGKNDIFFKLIDILLNISENVHVLIATPENDVVKNKVSHLNFKNRVHLIGYRDDIDAVFKNSHVYLSTYPFLGGLMTQYAAANGLPILAYAEENEPNVVEAMVNHKNVAVKTNRSIEEFTNYAQKLTSDIKFRESEGKKNKDAIFNEQDFYESLGSALSNHDTNIQWTHKEVPDYEGMIDFYIETENNMLHSALILSIIKLKLSVFKFFPKQTVTLLQLICRGTFKRLIRPLISST